jgi:site-specific DNA-methyltransferase (adenine-specific)
MAMLDPVIIGDAELWHGDCLEVMARMPENSIAAIVCDPPYLLNFMGKAFDKQHKALPGANEGQKMQAWHARWVAEAFRILKPGGYLVAFGGDRTHHRLLAAMEDAGFELRQNLYWAFGSGFPKSQNAGKALDQKAGAEREVVGTIRKLASAAKTHKGWERPLAYVDGEPKRTMDITAPDAARKWEGFGSALKPAVEIICCARKPMIGTLADNLLAWGCGALNIDATRVPGTPEATRFDPTKHGHDGWRMTATGEECAQRAQQTTGRYPAHLLHDNSPEVVAMFPATTSGKAAKGGHKRTAENMQKGSDIYGGGKGIAGTSSTDDAGVLYGDTGSAARFFQACPYDAADHDPLFYSGKAAKRDREEGCGGLEERTGSELTGRKEGSAGLVGDAENRGQTANPYANGTPRALNHHISVKPTALMRWLVRLFVPPGETVLDPFMGSGSTLKAALLENKTCMGIEMDPEYFAIAVERIKHVSPDDFALEYQS